MVKLVTLFGFVASLASGLHVKTNHETKLPDRISIQADNGVYLSRCNNCGPGLYQDSASVHEVNPATSWTKWNVEQVGSQVALKGDNGKYLARCKDCWLSTPGDAVFVNADSPTGDALWTVTLLKNEMWAFQGSNGKYLRRCVKCVQNAEYDDFAFVNIDNAYDDWGAMWIVK